MRYPLLVLPLLLLGCASTEDSTSYATMMAAPDEVFDAEARERLFSQLERLMGRWQMDGPEGPVYIEFDLTAGGSVLRETMFPGTESEMVNMYSLNGNSLMMTHYCAGKNQPRMKGHIDDEGNLSFEAFAVTDLADSSGHYMDSLTLAFIDEDTIEERWTSIAKGEQGEMPVFRLTRVR